MDCKTIVFVQIGSVEVRVAEDGGKFTLLVGFPQACGPARIDEGSISDLIVAIANAVRLLREHKPDAAANIDDTLLFAATLER